MGKVYDIIDENYQQHKALFALLIDTDDVEESSLKDLLLTINESQVDLVFVGGSLLVKNNFEDLLLVIKRNVNVPVVLFPGNYMQVSSSADAILFMSLISGRNPEYLIGQQVVSAPRIKSMNLEPISTGYILVDSGVQTSVSYMSNTTPVPRNKIDIGVSTAIAGEMLGNKLIYLDGGSGAVNSIPLEMISSVKRNISVPLVVGGGLSSADKIKEVVRAGADIVVVGSAVEKDLTILKELVAASKITR